MMSQTVSNILKFQPVPSSPPSVYSYLYQFLIIRFGCLLTLYRAKLEPLYSNLTDPSYLEEEQIYELSLEREPRGCTAKDIDH